MKTILRDPPFDGPAGKLRGQSRDCRLLTVFASVASLASFLWFFLHHELLLYGDAVAHINIARRIFDSPQPGADQLGTVWLPLPHLLSLPFLVNNWMWRAGIGGSIPSMIAYVLAVIGMFRLVRDRASFTPASRIQASAPAAEAAGAPRRGPQSRLAAWLAAALVGLNPNLLYMQATAMTESIFLAALIWAVVYFDQFVCGIRGSYSIETIFNPSKGSLSEPPSDGAPGNTHSSAPKALERCGIVLAAAILTRYDGWLFAFVIGCAVVVVVFLHRESITPSLREPGSPASPHLACRDEGLRRSLIEFLLLCALMPALWLADNYYINYKPLDWWNGPYSAQAIERRTGHGQPYPGKHNAPEAAKYFLKAARLNFSGGFGVQRTPPAWSERLCSWQTWMLALAILGTLIAVFSQKWRVLPWLLLWFPLPFYAYAVAYGSVPIFLPVWWPFSYYNVRYGLELLPAFAVFTAVAASFLVERIGVPGKPEFGLLGWRIGVPGKPASGSPWWRIPAARTVVTALLLVLLSANYLKVAADTPICLREARVNSVTRMHLESQLAPMLAALPPGSTVLMYTGEYVGAVQSAGVHLKRVVNESVRMVWDAGLSCPAQVADYVVAVDGDAVAEAVARNPRWLEKVAAFSTPGKPDVTVYRSRFPGR